VASRIKTLLRRFGWDVVRYAPQSSPLAQLRTYLRKSKVDLIFDVGANTGQFVRQVRSVGYAGRVVSFEPLTTAWRALKAFSRTDQNWTVHPRYAVGDKIGEVQIHVPKNSLSSSILPMLEAHSSAAPSSVYVSSETVPVITLDSVFSEYVSESN